ncbi:MAG: hypothetical protein ACD_65C00302G0002 [uncultured bacterium]|nr:MAG: hypothetical protein ACD_65C00302G0002 [uncultured bacterium]
MQAVLRQTRISPKKANLVAGLVRGKNVEDALAILKFTPKKGAGILAKVVKSAAANAENNFKQDKNSLFIKEIIVNEGITYKRSLPCSRGRMHPILKRNSHITVKLDAKADLKPEPKIQEKAEAETPATEEKPKPKKKSLKKS